MMSLEETLVLCEGVCYKPSPPYGDLNLLFAMTIALATLIWTLCQRRDGLGGGDVFGRREANNIGRGL